MVPRKGQQFTIRMTGEEIPSQASSTLWFSAGAWLSADILCQTKALGWDQDLHGGGPIWFTSVFLLTVVFHLPCIPLSMFQDQKALLSFSRN